MILHPQRPNPTPPAAGLFRDVDHHRDIVSL
jgi:hypothetical protein